jgi:hypothetical protein
MGDIEQIAKYGEKNRIANIKKEISTIKSYFGDYNYVSALGSHYIPNAINRYREARKKAMDLGIDVKEFDDKVAKLTSDVLDVPLSRKVDFDHYTRMKLILEEHNKDLN